MRWENVPSGASLAGRLPPSAFLYQPEENRYICRRAKCCIHRGAASRGQDCFTTVTKPMQKIADLPSQAGVLSGQ